jgi:hypothetical protein
MAGKNNKLSIYDPFREAWLACLFAHYIEAVGNRDTESESNLRAVLERVGMTEEDIRAARREALPESLNESVADDPELPIEVEMITALAHSDEATIKQAIALNGMAVVETEVVVSFTPDTMTDEAPSTTDDIQASPAALADEPVAFALSLDIVEESPLLAKLGGKAKGKNAPKPKKGKKGPTSADDDPPDAQNSLF